MDTHIYHGFNEADIASDTMETDRQKMYVHEKISCGYKAQLHFETCNAVPTLVGEFSLAIDNCIPFVDSRFKDYGQCNNLDVRTNSIWWHDHIQSFAMRQISTYERELGWCFWTYKLDDIVEATDLSASYWSFRLAASKGYFDKTWYSKVDACILGPEANYDLGDLAYDPTMSPSAPNFDIQTAVYVASNNSRNFLLFSIPLIGLVLTLGIGMYSKYVKYQVYGRDSYSPIATFSKDQIQPSYQKINMQMEIHSP
jgi:hypothetical protein